MKRHLSSILAIAMLVSNCSFVHAADVKQADAESSFGPTDISVISSMASAVSEDDEVIFPEDNSIIAEDEASYETAADPAEDEALEAYSAEDEASIEAYADNDEQNMVHIKDSDGKYIMYFKVDYKYADSQTSGQGNQNSFKRDGTFAQLRNISAIDGQSMKGSDVKVPDYVTFNGKEIPVVSIKKSAFEGCPAKSVTLPDTIHEIQERAFYNCPDLESVYIETKYYDEREGSDGTEYEFRTDADGNYIDLDNSKANLKSLIGKDAFNGCKALKKVYIRGFAEIRDNAFQGCSSLTDITIDNSNIYTVSKEKVVTAKPELVCTLGANAFNGCSALKVLNTGHISTLGKNSLLGCTALETIEIEKSFATDLTYAYILECKSLKEFKVSEESTKYTDVDGVLYSKTSGKVVNEDGVTEVLTYPVKLLVYPPNKKDNEIVIPDTVTEISSKAFFGHEFINSVIVDTKPKYIVAKDGTVSSEAKTLTVNSEAFAGAPSLVKVEFRTPVDIGKAAFQKCEKLTDLICGARTNIGSSAFADCTALNKWLFTDNATWHGKIESYAFQNCVSLPGLDLRYHDYIGTHAFDSCTGLKYLTLLTTGTCGDYAFTKCTGLENVDMSLIFANLGECQLGKYVFSDCTSLKTCKYTDEIDGISVGTFKNCTALTDFTNQNEKYMFCIYAEAFYNCTSLKNAPSSRFLTRIDKDAFGGCTSLTGITLTRSAVILDEAAFSNCSHQFTISTPKGYTGETYAHLVNIPSKVIPNDIQDEEFLLYGYVKDPADSTGKTFVLACVGYLGGFTSLTLPEDITINGQLIDIFGGATSNYKPLPDSIHFETVGKKDLDIPEDVDYGFNPSKDAWISSPANEKCSMKPYLESVTLTGMRYISPSAFAGCSALKSVKFDNKLETIGKSAFIDCKALETVDFSDGTQPELEFCTTAFKNCASIKEIEFPLNTKIIREACFENCSGLEFVKFSPKIQDIELKAFQNCPAITSVTLHSNNFVHDDAFAKCTNITRIIMPPSTNTATSTKAFSGCDPRNTYVLCEKDSKLGEYAEKAGFNIEYVDVREDENGYTVIDCKINFPEEINVSSGGKTLKSGDFIQEDDVLSVSYNQSKLDPAYFYSVRLNNKGLEVPESGSINYTVHENEYIDITVNKGERQTLTYPDGVTVLKNGTALVNKTAYIIAGDELEIKASDDPYKSVSNIKYNGTNIPKDGKITVKDKNIEVTAVVKTAGKLTFPAEMVVKIGKEIITESPSPVFEKTVISFEAPTPEEGYENKLYVNGVLNKDGKYTVKTLADNANQAENVNITFEVAAISATGEYKYGDADADNQITASDAAAILQRVLNESFKPALADKTPAFVAYLDVDGDNAITASDAASVLQKVLNETFKFPVETKK